MSRRLIGASCALACAIVVAFGESVRSESLLVVTPAQTLGAAPAPQGPQDIAPDREGPDESALRYYAAQNQTARVQAEISRLRRLYPNWTPPADLYSSKAGAGEDESALWALFAADRLDDLRAAIARRERQEPGWTPSTDLQQKLRRKETHAKIMKLWVAARWRALVAFVRSPSYDPADVDVDALWSVAEALARTKQTSDAIAVYRSILTTDDNAHERLATFQKAMATLPMNDVETLLSLARRLPDGRPEYAPIMIDIIRARMSAWLDDARADPVPPDQLQAFEDYARASPQPDQAALTAWYYFKLKAYDVALDWFKLAMTRGGDAMVAHGLANCLIALGYDREAEEVAYAWRRPLVNNEILFVDVVGKQLTQPSPSYIEPERLARFAQTVMDTESGEGAQALAWYAYNTCQFEIALEWFRRAATWRPSEPTMRGYALTLRRLGKRAAFFDAVNRYDGLFAGVEDLLFPDGTHRAPTLCERQRRSSDRGAQRLGDFTVPGPAARTDGGARVAADPIVASVARDRPTRMPRIDRREFPVSTDPENLLGAAPAKVVPDELGLTYLPEPSRGPWPLVARRVPGVGPMPYERYGFALLPAWNGETRPTWPPYAAQPAPPGTLWRLQAQEGAAQQNYRVGDNRSASRRPRGDAPFPASPTASSIPVSPASERHSGSDWTDRPPPPTSAPAPVAAPPAPPFLVDPGPSLPPSPSAPEKSPPLEKAPVSAIPASDGSADAAPTSDLPILAGGAAPASILAGAAAPRPVPAASAPFPVDPGPSLPPSPSAPEKSPPLDKEPVGAIPASDGSADAAPISDLPILAGGAAPASILAGAAAPQPVPAASAPQPGRGAIDAEAPSAPPAPSADRRIPPSVRPSWSVGAALAAARQFRQGGDE